MENIIPEFNNLKFEVQNDRFQKLKSDEFWAVIYKESKSKYHNLLLLVELLLCMPFSTAVVERGFSAIRRIITDWRAHLSHKMVTDLMHFSTRKLDMDNYQFREKLIEDTGKRFVGGDDHEEKGLSKRRLNKLLSGDSSEPLLKKMRSDEGSDEEFNQ